MDEKEVTFPLSYEQMTSAAEEEITRLLKNQDTATLLNRWEQASGVQTFWNNLAINFMKPKMLPKGTGYLRTGDGCSACSDCAPQETTRYDRAPDAPPFTAAAGTDCAGRPRCEKSGTGGRGILSGCWSRAGTPRCTGLTSAPPAGAWKPRAGCAPCAPRTCSWPLS
jgi:hypothetical protein